MKFALTLSRKAMILVAVPLVFELAFVGTLTALLYQVDAERAREAHSRDLASHLNSMLRIMLSRSMASFVYHATDSPSAHQRFHQCGKLLAVELKELSDISANDPHEHSIITQCEDTIAAGDEKYRDTRASMKLGDKVAAGKSALSVERGLNSLSTLIENFLEEQQGVQLEKKQAQARLRATAQGVLYAGVLFNILLAIILVMYFNRGTSKRLELIMDNIVSLGHDKPLHPPLGGEDELAEIDAIFRSMSTDLKEARRRERAILENALAVICSINITGKFFQVNPASLALWGYEPSELVGQPLLKYVLEDDVEQTTRMLERYIKEQTQGSFENRIKKRDGSVADVHWSVQWSAAEKSLFCVAHDISAEKEIERLKRNFVTMVSHDLKTPLMTIQMVLELLGSDAFGALNENGHDRIGMAEDEVERLMRMVKELLDIEKLESGEHDLTMAPSALKTIIQKGIDSVSGLAAREGVAVVMMTDDGVDASTQVECDSDRIIQVVTNLMSNAVKFSPKGGTVKARLRRRGNSIEVRIEDEGRGIPKELQESIFDRFRQVEHDDARVKGGSGLGLAICKTIVEQHGSKMILESEEGKGSVFSFTLPLSANVPVKKLPSLQA